VRRAARALCVAVALCAAADAAHARIPSAETVARAAADASRAQGRSKAFRFSVTVRATPESPPLAQGELLVDPAGAARIELRHADGFIERQIRRPSGLAAARDGERLDAPHPLAPPLWPVLAATGGELLQRAGELGAAPGAIALAYDGARDCYVLGGIAGGPSVWIDEDTYQVARVDLADGTKARFLAWASRGGAILPSAVEIETPALSFTLELTAAAATTAGPDDFSDAWLGAR
jgi:hypothetical protein